MCENGIFFLFFPRARWTAPCQPPLAQRAARAGQLNFLKMEE